VETRNQRQLDFGVDFEPFRSHKKSPTKRMRIGFIGQILPHKGLDLLVDALAKIQNQDGFELLIYGSLSDPSEKTYFDSLDLRAIRNQRWLGTFDLSQMNQILQNIDLLVVPSRWPENCPLVPKYALLTGTRLIISSAPGILVDPFGEGIEVFKMGDVKGLGDKIQKLIESGVWQTPIASRKDLVTHISDHAALVEKIYQEAG
jgi:glycosyltransferase involved in cell wall biosynthesis